MKKPLKQKPHQYRLILEELEARQLFSGGIEGLIDTQLTAGATVTYLDAEASNPQALSTDSTESAAEQLTQEIVFVDTGIDNYQTLVDDILNNSDSSRNIEVVLLNDNENGIDVISTTLQDRDDLDAIHIISHGDDGSVQLGNTTLNADTLSENNLAIALWANAFTETGDILIYGCNLAETELGQNLINDLSELTLADVAASTDLTGHSSRGGDWDLEHNVGTIESAVALSQNAQQNWNQALDITTGLQVHHTYDAGQGAQDASGNNLDGILSDNAAVDTSAGTNQIGDGKLTLDGTNDYVNLNTHASSLAGFSEGTISAWINTSSSTQQQTIFNFSDASGSDFAMLQLTSTGHLKWWVSDNGSTIFNVESVATYNDGNWHHVAVSVDTTNGTKLWVDGVELTGPAVDYGAYNPSSHSFFSDLANISQAEIGAFEISGTMYEEFNGLIDDFRIYDRALTAGDISELHTNSSNAAPVNSVPSAQTTNEDTALVFSSANGNLISISDADAGANLLETTISVNNGILTLSGTSGLTFVSGSDGSNTMTVTGTLTDINSALDGMSFTPDADFNGAANLQITTYDETGLLGAYSFDNVANLGADNSPGTTNDGTVSGATQVTDPERGEVLNFVDSVPNDGVTITGLYGSPSNVTLSAWIDFTKPVPTPTGTGMVISLGDAVAIRVGDYTTDAVTGFFYDGTNWHEIEFNASISGTGWHHVAYTFDDISNTQKLYLDGVEVASGTITSSISYTSPAIAGGTLTNTTIGTHSDPDEDQFAFVGNIDDAQIYDRALTAVEIADIMNAPPGMDSDTVAITVNAVNDAPNLWNYHHDITLGAATAIADYPVKIELTEGVNSFNHAHVLANGEDIRFYDSAGNQLDYWIEDWNNAGTSTIWVKVATAGTQNINLYYGNIDVAAASDATTTFLFHDDFEDADSAGWTAVGGATSGAQPSVVNDAGNQVLSDGVNSGGPVVATGAWSDVAVNQDFRTINAADPINHAGVIARYEDANNMVYGGIINSTTAQIWVREAGTWTQIGGNWDISAFTVDDGNWHNQELRVFGDTVEVYIDGTFIGSASLASTGSSAGTSGQTGFWSQYSNYEGYRDNHSVRSFDTGTGEISSTLANEGFSVTENSANATIVGSVLATDIDGDPLSYSITTGNTNGAFSIDANGVITVANSAALDFETTPTFNLTVEVDDGNGGIDSDTITIVLKNVNEAPTIVSTLGTVNYTEGDGDVVINNSLSIIDVDDTHLESATISISSAYVNGEDTLSFTDQNGITGSWNVTTGVLTLSGTSSVANYQAALQSITYNNSSQDPDTTTRTVSFTVNDGTLDSNAHNRNITIAAVNDDPIITSSAAVDTVLTHVPENTTTVTTVSASDVDLDTVTFSISGGIDSNLFDMDPNTGELTFKTIKDFETPEDNDSDNVYIVEVTAHDGNGGIDVQTLHVQVTNVSESAPLSAADSYSVDENNTLSTDWWDSNWTQRQQITFDNLAQTETLFDFPVLVVLNSGNIDYTQTNDDGSDLRFLAADGTPLDYEIETWDETGDSAVWVRIPQITGNSNTDSISMYYGNASATAPNMESVWDADFVGVWHLNQEQAGTGNVFIYEDATGNGHDGIDRIAATGQAGQVAEGQNMGDGDWIEINHDPALNLQDSMTFSFWINPDTDMGTFNRVIEKGLWGYGSSYYFGGGNGTNDLTFYLNGQEVIETPDNTLSVGVWQHVALSFTYNGDGTGSARMYLNGSEIATGNYNNGPITGNTGRLAFGHENSTYDFDGSLDEVQISSSARSADWIAAQYQATLNQFGNEFVQFGVVETAQVVDGVMTNDSDADNDLLTASLVSGPANATAFQFNQDGTFSYTPTNGFSGTDSFTYKVNDGTLDGNTQTVTITVNAVNTPPTAQDNTIVTAEDTPYTFSLADFGYNDVDGDPIAQVRIWPIFNDVIELNGVGLSASLHVISIADINNGNLTLVPPADGWGTADFMYFDVNDGSANSAPYTMTVNITPVNDAPVANDDPGIYSTSIQDLNPLGYWRLGDAAGTAMDLGSSANNGTYNGGTVGQTGGLYGDVNTAVHFDGTEYIEISHSNDYLLDNGSLQLWFNSDTPASGDLQHLFSKDAHGFVDGGHLSMYLNSSGQLEVRLQSSTVDYIVSSSTAVSAGNWHHAAFSFGSNGMQLYLDGQLVDTDTYTGGLGTTSGGTGNIEDIAIGGGTQNSPSPTVGTVNQLFTGSIDEVALFGQQLDAQTIERLFDAGTNQMQVNENGLLNLDAASGVLANDTDIDGDALIVSEVNGNAVSVGTQISLASGALLTLNADGSMNYDPNGQFEHLKIGETATDTFNYTIDDGNGETDTATVTVTIQGENDAPQITSNGAGVTANIDVAENTTSVTTVTATDPDLETPTFTLSGGADQALFNIDPNSGFLTFNTAQDFDNPTDSDTDNVYVVEVTASDGQGGTDVQTISVTVTDRADGIRVIPQNIVALGDETLVNSETSGIQNIGANVSQAMATDANGNYVIVWTSAAQDTDGWGVYAQLFYADGSKQGSEIAVNTTTTDDQTNPTVAMDDSGNFIVTWQSLAQDGDSAGVYTRAFNSSGVAQTGEVRVNSTTAGYQGSPGMAMAPNGDYVVIWTMSDGDGNGIYAQLFNASGVAQGGEFRVNTTTTNQQQVSSVSMDDSGNFVVTWGSLNQDGDNYGVFAQLFNADGTTRGDEFQVNTTTANSQLYSDVVMLSDGRFVVAYQSTLPDTSVDLYVQTFNADGSMHGSEIKVNAAPDIDYFPIPSITADEYGNFTVAWNNANDGDQSGVFVKSYDWSGNPLTGEIQVNTTSMGNQLNPEIVSQPGGGFIVAWGGNGPGDSDGVFTQRYGLATAEDGSTTRFQLVLESAPTDDVTIPISVSDPSEGSVSTGSVTFNAGNWDTPQTVTVTGLQDFIFDGDIPFTVNIGPASSSDPNFNGLDPQDLVITNIDGNTPPQITSAANVNADENQTAVTTVSANDVDGDTPTFSISGGADAAWFDIDTNTGVLTFTNPQDFENPTDSDSNNVYRVEVTASDGLGGTDTQLIQVTVDDANDAPVANADDSHLVFDGNDMVRVADDAALQMTDTLTLEAWFKLDNSAIGSQLILNKEGEYEVGVNADTGEIRFAITQSDNTWNWHGTGHTINADEWLHVAVTYDGVAGEARTYVNGELVDTYAQSGTVGDVYTGFNDLTIGGRENDADERFQGQINDVRLWNITRSASDIRSSYHDVLAGNESGLAGYWRLDDVAGTQVSDLSGNGNHGVLGGAEGAASAPVYDGYSTDQNSLLVIAAGQGVLANDTDQDGDNLSVTNLDTSSLLGNLVLNTADGSFSYDPNGAFDHLDEGEIAYETFTYTANDGLADSNVVTVTITVTGVEDAPTLDNPLPDQTATEDSAFSFTFNANSFNDLDTLDTLTYSATLADDSALPAWLSFDAGTRTFSGTPANADVGSIAIKVTADDGNSSVTDSFTLTVNNTSDAPVIGGDNVGTVTEDVDVVTNIISASGLLTISDPDAGESSFQAATVNGSYGDLTIDVAGNWSYSADNSQAAIQSLDNGQILTDTLTIQTFDGSHHNIVITINGTEDDSVIGGVVVGTVSEDSTLTASDTLTITDMDTNDNPVSFNDLASATGSNGYGSYTMSANTWTYTLNNNLAAVQALDAGETLTDSFNFTTSDGKTQSVTVTIQGSEDAPTLDNAIADQSATEDTAFSFTFNANSFGDLDTSDTLTYSATLADDSALPAWLSFDSGTRTFSGTPANADVGSIDIKVSADDGSSSVTDSFTLTVYNSNDAAVIGGTDTGAVQEDVAVLANAITTMGALTITDPDVGESSFYAETVNGSYGALTIDTSGNWSYSADNTQAAIQSLDVGESLTDTLSVQSFDGTPHDIVITINGSEDAALISGTTSGSVSEDGSLTTSGTLNITDVDISDSPSFTDVASTSGDNGYGSFSMTGGTWTYTLDNNRAAVQALDDGETLTDTYTFTASDSSTQQVSVTINGSNDAPVFDSTAVTAATEGLAYSYTITTSDVDIEAVSITAPTLPSWLSFVDNGDGTAALSGTPGNAEVGSHTVVLTVSDGVLSSNQSFTINVANTNDAAVIGGTDTGAVQEDVAVLANALTTMGALTITDPDVGESSFYAETVNGSYGAMTIDTSGNWSYSADNTQAAIQSLDVGESLTDTLTVRAFDGTPHNIVITINGSEDSAVIGGTTSGSVSEDGSLTTSGTLNITDVDISDSPSFTDVASTSGDNGYGSFSMTGGTWTYTLDNNLAAVQALANGETLTDTLTFSASDGSTQQVTVTILGANDLPTLDNPISDQVATEDNPFSFSFAANTFSDADSSDLLVYGATLADDSPLPSWLTFDAATRTFSGTPTNDDVGIISIKLFASDGTERVYDTFNLTVINTNDAPVTSTVTLAAINEDGGPHIITQAQLLANALDVDIGDVITATNLSITSGSGSLVSNGDGSWTYTPALNDDSAVTFSYSITDGMEIIPATATLDILPVNDAPIAVSDNFMTSEDVPLNNIDVLGNDNDIDGDLLSVVSATALHGTVTINPDSTLHYIPDADFNGIDSISYSIDDGHGGTASSTVTITVHGVSDIVDDTVTTSEDTAVSINLFDNDNFSSSVLITSVTQGNHGSVTFVENGTVTYTPDTDFSGNDSFTYTATTANGDTETATVNVTVNPAKDANNDSVTTLQASPVNLNVMANDSFGPGASITNISQAAHGSVALEANGTISYAPDVDFIGSDRFSYTVTDVEGNTETATIEVMVQQRFSVAPVEIPSADVNPDQPNDSEIPQNTIDSGTEESVQGDEPLSEQSLIETNNEPTPADGLSNIDEMIDNLTGMTQENPVENNTVQNFNANFEPTVSNERTIQAKAEQKPETLAQLIQLQAYQDQIANQSLLSDVDLELDIEHEEQLLSRINDMHEQIDHDLSSEEDDQIEVQIALGSSVGLTAGFVSWVLRGGSLLASMMSTLPLLNRFDPLPIVKSRSEDKKVDDEENEDTQLKNATRVDELFSKNTKDEP